MNKTHDHDLRLFLFYWQTSNHPGVKSVAAREKNRANTSKGCWWELKMLKCHLVSLRGRPRGLLYGQIVPLCIIVSFPPNYLRKNNKCSSDRRKSLDYLLDVLRHGNLHLDATCQSGNPPRITAPRWRRTQCASLPLCRNKREGLETVKEKGEKDNNGLQEEKTERINVIKQKLLSSDVAKCPKVEQYVENRREHKLTSSWRQRLRRCHRCVCFAPTPRKYYVINNKLKPKCGIVYF